MNIFSRLFGSSDEQRAKRIIKDTVMKVERTTTPLGVLGMAMVNAAWTCAQAVKPMIKIVGEEEKQLAEIYVFYEFVYFFMHLTMRSAFSQLTESQIGRLQAYLGPLISSTAVDSFFPHWPEALKEKIMADFYSKLNAAEIEYSECKELLSKEHPLTGNSLFLRLARNIAALSGDPTNPETLVSVIGFAVDAHKTMNLDSLVWEAGKVL